jgi:AMP deaminase
MDSIEPKIFPGVVSRRRRSSLRSGSAYDDVEGEHVAHHAAHSGFRRKEESAVVEEKDSDDEQF